MSFSNRVSLDTNVIFLRDIFAFSSNNIPLSTNYVMAVGANGQVFGQDILRILDAYGVGYLPSTFSTLEGQITSTGLTLLSGVVTADQLTSSQNYLLSTICSVQSNVETLSSYVLATILPSSFTSYNNSITSLNSSFQGYVASATVTPANLTSTTDGILSTTNTQFSSISTSIGQLSNTFVAGAISPIMFSNLSTGVSTQSNYFSGQVVGLSNTYVALSNWTRLNLSNQSVQIDVLGDTVSTMSSQVYQFSNYLDSFSSATQDPQYILGLLSTRPVTVFGSTIVASSLLVYQSTLVAFDRKVGVNKLEPTVALDIVGSVNFTGALTSNGQSYGIPTANFDGLSTTVLGQSTTIRSISDSLSVNWISLSNVSTYVRTLSTQIGQVSLSLSTNWSNTSNVSTYVVSLSTSVGQRFDSGGGGGGVSQDAFDGLSTFVLGQSTTIRAISDSLSTNWSNTSNVSTYVVSLSTSVGQRFDSGGGGGGISQDAFDGLSSFVLVQSTTIRAISDSLSTNWSNTSNVSTYVVSLSTSVGQRFDSGGGGGGVSQDAFDGLSSFVLVQSTTIRAISDSLSTNWLNLVSLSSFVREVSAATNVLGTISAASQVWFGSNASMSTAEIALDLNVGRQNTIDSSAFYAAAVGSNTRVSGTGCIATGMNTWASSLGATAAGFSSFAGSSAAQALGWSTVAIGAAATAMGRNTVARANYSFIGGFQSSNSATASNSFGYGFIAQITGTGAAGFGYNPIASGIYSFSAGCNNTTSGVHASGFGALNIASGDQSFAGGYVNLASGSRSFVIGTDNIGSATCTYVEGIHNIGTGQISHTEGCNNYTGPVAACAHAEGWSTVVMGIAGHAEGYKTIAHGDYSHAEGFNVSSIGFGSHAQGISTITVGIASHAEGTNNVAFGYASHAGGSNTSSIGIASFTGGVETRASGIATTALGNNTIASGNYSFATGSATEALGISAFAEGQSTLAGADASHAEGSYAIAYGNYSHAEGAETKTLGIGAHAEGISTLASGKAAHAEGYSTVATGINSHAEGTQTVASGDASHAEGYYTVAYGTSSHAEGAFTSSIGITAHVGGFSNTAASDFTHATGAFAKSHLPAATTVGGAAFSNFDGTAVIPGSGQTNTFNAYGLSDTAGGYISLQYVSTITNFDAVNIPLVVQASNYFMQTVNLRLTGHEQKYSAGSLIGSGTAGRGFYFAEYNFHVYWDNQSPPVLYLCDCTGTTGANGTTTVLSTIRSVNKMESLNTIDLRAFISSVGSGLDGNGNQTGYYTLEISRSVAGVRWINWHAHLTVEEIMATAYITGG